MRFFICAIPLFDTDMVVHAYRMMTHDGEKLLGAAEDFRMLSDELLASALEYVREIGVEPFAGQHDFFVDISKYQLLMGMPLSMNIPTDKLVCVIDKETLADNAAYAKLGILKRRGYRLAVDGLPQTISIDTAVNFFDYVLLNSKAQDFKEDLKTILPYILKIKLVISDIPDMDNFKKLANARGVLLSGNFYSQPITKGLSSVSPLKLNTLRILAQINDDNFDLGVAADTVEKDPALSISLLRFINTMNPGRSRKIDSIRNAVAILGQNEVKKWAAVAVSVSIGEDRPGEITRLSLIRAKFAENLAPAFGLAIKSGALFISGLFSLLDIILQMPLRQAIGEVAVHSDIREALLDNSGLMYEVLSLIFAYERADWYNASLIMVRNGIDIDTLSRAFMDSLYWYRRLLDAIDDVQGTDGAQDVLDER
ncbi:MAG: HDOD domain-containing protein [Oscillospiraceae bacterium]|nr:HDOD domain-containing protein [Oscillospiraceae bacterium]